MRPATDTSGEHQAEMASVTGENSVLSSIAAHRSSTNHIFFYFCGFFNAVILRFNERLHIIN